MNALERLIRGVSLFGFATTMQIVLSSLRKAYAAARFAEQERRGPALWLATWRELRRRPAAPPSLADCTQPGAVQSHTVKSQTTTLTCANAHLHATVLADDLMRVQVQRQGETSDAFSYAIARQDADWPPIAFTVGETMTAVEVRTARLTCHIEKTTGRLTFLDPQRDGAPITQNSALGWRGQQVACALTLSDDEHIYGLGEKAFGLDRRGRVYDLWNSDPGGAYLPGKDPLYLNVPFYIGLRRQAAYGVLFDNSHRARIDCGSNGSDVLVYQAEGGPLRYYFFYGPQAAAILDRYTQLTGRLRLPPLWALGYHQSRWSYTPDSQVRAIAAEFRRRRLPCDAIHLDIDYMNGYRCFTWHPEHFPKPAALIGDLHRQGFKVIPIIDCGIKNDPWYVVCTDGLRQKVFCALPDGAPFHGPVWPGDCYFPDFTSPHVRAWWGRQLRPLVESGIDGIWNDMNEPTVFGWVADSLPDCVRHDWEGRGSNHAEAHNVYGLQMARATAEGLQALRPNRRTFVITRSAWAGLQRYAMNWMGDNRSTWEHLRLTMPMVMNLGLCGLAFTGPDTGGFAGAGTPELLTRWMQLGVFTPFFRNHSALGTPSQEPWVHGEPYESINRRYLELRYHLLPYIYTAFWQCSQTGLPMLRPLFLHWQDDERAHTIEDEFMFGDVLLIAPVGEPGAVGRNVYLPTGTWYDWWTGELYEGGQTIRTDTPLERLPIFARAGSVVPAWPIMQYVGERPVERLVLHIFPGDGQSVLYEDDGRSLGYQQGEYRVTTFSVHWQGDTLTVERASQGRFTPPYTKVELAVHGLSGPVCTVSANGKPVPECVYDDATRSVHCRCPLAQAYSIVT